MRNVCVSISALILVYQLRVKKKKSNYIAAKTSVLNFQGVVLYILCSTGDEWGCVSSSLSSEHRKKKNCKEHSSHWPSAETAALLDLRTFLEGGVGEGDQGSDMVPPLFSNPSCGWWKIKICLMDTQDFPSGTLIKLISAVIYQPHSLDGPPLTCPRHVCVRAHIPIYLGI